MNTIYKYTIDNIESIVSDNNKVGYDIEMPVNSKILSAKVQNGNLCIWALVDPDYELETRTVFVIGTGWPLIDVIFSTRKNIEQKINFIDTVLLGNGAFVYHIFG